MISVKSSIPDIVEWLDLEKLHVHAPSDAVLVCGGQQNVKSKKSLSLRDAFLKVSHNPPLSKLTFRLAEETSVTEKKSAYNDWMNFESDLAQLCQLIVLFCESEGSIAELALFVSIDEIARRLVVIIDNESNSAGSYVNSGPIAAFVNEYGREKKFVLNLPDIGIKRLSDIGKVDLNALRLAVQDYIYEAAQLNKEPRSFIRDRAGHKIKLVTGLIQHYGALTEVELEVLLYCLGIEAKEADIKKYVQCADFLGWIKAEERGVNIYWVPIENGDAIEYALLAGAPTINKSAWRARVRQYWSKVEPERFSAINANAVRVTL